MILDEIAEALSTHIEATTPWDSKFVRAAADVYPLIRIYPGPLSKQSRRALLTKGQIRIDLDARRWFLGFEIRPDLQIRIPGVIYAVPPCVDLSAPNSFDKVSAILNELHKAIT